MGPFLHEHVSIPVCITYHLVTQWGSFSCFNAKMLCLELKKQQILLVTATQQMNNNYINLMIWSFWNDLSS